MINYLRLVRFQNLFFIAFIQYVMHQVVLLPILQTYGFNSVLEGNMLCLLIIATVFIAAGGYVLNDYFDLKIDAINRGNKQIIGKTVTRRKAMALHQIITAIGSISGLLLAIFSRSFTLALVFIVVPGLLWFYSTTYKRQFLTGNLVVSFISALSVLIIGITQIAFLHKEYGNLIYETPIPSTIHAWIGGFALFSFLSTFIREIIKDLEDEKGDRELECRTMAIVWGTKKTKNFLYVIIGLTIGFLFLVNQVYIPFDGTLTLRYILLGLVLPLLILAGMVFFSTKSTEYHNASTLSKFIMVVGVLYSFVFYYLQAKAYGFSLFDLFIVK